MTLTIQLNHVRPSLTTIYAVVFAPDDQVFNPLTGELETFDLGSWEDYAIVASPADAIPTRYDISVNTTGWADVAGKYTAYFYERTGANPVRDDDLAFGNVYVTWDGTSVNDCNEVDALSQYPVIDDVVIDEYKFTIYYYNTLANKTKHNKFTGLVGVIHVEGEEWVADA